ncbi:NADPH-dependent FMN reductase [Nonomuraea rubra]|uniref:Chromate reductase n=1 Tax=Nonomuraea rubra TaxID=46180 RepID=A0A7X0NZX1_9ACTN|nr:NAD(P)H-dependent oxidoreductase [Nonomuraea rubra]MBB6552529.1 chromate reductase [Nonomuraea rubra]
MKIIGIAASLHAGSFITRLLDAAGGELPPGVGFEVWRGLGEIPAYRPGPGAVPAPARELVTLVAGGDAILLTAPEHSLLPVELTYALDWMSAREGLSGKHVAVMSASARACGAMWAQAELYKQLLGAGAVVMGAELVISPTWPHFDEDGRLAAPGLRTQVRNVIRQLCPAEVMEPAMEPALSL